MITDFIDAIRNYIMDESRIGIMTVDSQGIITNCNTGSSNLIGVKYSLLGQKLADYFDIMIYEHIAHEDYAYGRINARKINEGELYHLKGISVTGESETCYIIEPGDFNDYDVFSQLSNIHLELANATREINRQNTMLLHKNEQIESLLYRDSLTMLYNRRYMLDYLSKMVEQDRDFFEEKDAVCLVDIDNFKEINTHFSQDTGDKVLVALSKILKDRSRESDICIRYGKDVFIILFKDIRESVLSKRIDLIRQEFSQLLFEGANIDFTVSCGVTFFKKGESISEIIERSTEALEYAKESGRDQYYIIK